MARCNAPQFGFERAGEGGTGGMTREEINVFQVAAVGTHLYNAMLPYLTLLHTTFSLLVYSLHWHFARAPSPLQTPKWSPEYGCMYST